MEFATIEQATAVLKDNNAVEKERVRAAHFLGRSGSEAVAEVLVAALDDDDYGVHWAASAGLAQLGEVGLPSLLRALASANCTTRVFEGAKHTFHNNSSRKVREETKELLQKMHGRQPNIATMQAASDLMIQLSIA